MDRMRGGAVATNDPRTQPAYSLTEAARYLRLPSGTLRAWIVGRPYPTSIGQKTSPAIVQPAQKQPPALSFWNLVEAHVLRALRTEHGVSAPDLRKALRFAEDELGIDRLLLRKDLLTDAGRIFLERYGQLVDLSNSGQLALRHALEAHLKRVEWDARRLPVRLYPFLSPDVALQDRPIAIDPRVAFGRPVVQRAGVSTRAIAERLDAGETVSDVARDYGLSDVEVEQAVLYERAA